MEVGVDRELQVVGERKEDPRVVHHPLAPREPRHREEGSAPAAPEQRLSTLQRRRHHQVPASRPPTATELTLDGPPLEAPTTPTSLDGGSPSSSPPPTTAVSPAGGSFPVRKGLGVPEPLPLDEGVPVTRSLSYLGKVGRKVLVSRMSTLSTVRPGHGGVCRVPGGPGGGTRSG